MPFSLIPDYLFNAYEEITPRFLLERGISLLLSDLDYTLAPLSVRRPDEGLRRWIRELEAAGVTVMIVSNNRSGVRVTEFCGDLGIEFQGRAGKPSTRGLRAAMARRGTGREHTAMLGDKLLTDVLAARRAGVLSLLVEPRGGTAAWWQKLLHVLQEPFKRIARRRLAEKNRLR